MLTPSRAQPFAVAEIFTGIEGKLVSLKDSIKSFKAILNGEGDSFPESGASALVWALELTIASVLHGRRLLRGRVRPCSGFEQR